ncbi:MAG: hypothetical protein Q9193_007036 [Seirophora villosa]
MPVIECCITFISSHPRLPLPSTTFHQLHDFDPQLHDDLDPQLHDLDPLDPQLHDLDPVLDCRNAQHHSNSMQSAAQSRSSHPASGLTGMHKTQPESDAGTSSINATSDGKDTGIFSSRRGNDIVSTSSHHSGLSPLVKRVQPPRGYKSLICAGDKYLTAIEAAFEGRIPGKKFDLKELQNGWTRTTTAETSTYAGVEARWEAAFEGLFGQSMGYPPRSEIKAVSLHQDKAYSTNIGKDVTEPTQAYSVGLYYPTRSMMLSTSSYGVPTRIQEMHQGITKEERNKLLPTISTLSDLMWLAWNTVSTSPGELRYIGRDKVYNEETMAVMDYLFVRDNQGETRNVPWPGLEYGGDSDEGKALLATPNGRATAWLLIDFAQEMKRKGEISRRELKIHIFSFVGDYCMLWDMEPQSRRGRAG